MGKRLDRDFYNQDVLEVAPSLLGQHLAIGLALLSLLQDGMGLAQEVMLLLAPLFLLQGLAVAHGLRANRGFHQAWLIGLYALFFFAFPYAELLVAGCGFADLWVNFRSRFGGRGPDSA